MDINEINREIQRLENGETDYGNCQKLAILYTVKNNICKTEPEQRQSYAAYSDSEFLSVSYSKDPYQVLEVLDEHIECIKTLYPAEYKALLKKIHNI